MSQLRRLHSLPVLLLTLFVLGAPALGQANLRRMVTFGDSLTHNTILWIYYGTWRDLYGDDPMEAVWMQGAVGGDTLTSYAIAGSESDDVLLQIDTYMFFEWLGFEPRPSLVGFEIGGNDIMNNIDLLKRYAPGVDARADRVINDLANNIHDGMRELWQEYKCQFILWNVPDVTVTPDLYTYLNPVERTNVRAHIARVNMLLAANANQAPIALIDVYTILEEFVTDPPVIYGQTLIGPPAKGDYDHVFADEIHPTKVSNLILANEIIEVVNLRFRDDIPLYTEDELAAAAKFN